MSRPRSPPKRRHDSDSDSDEKKPKEKKLTAYRAFVDREREALQARGYSFQETTRLLAEKWRDMPESERAAYKSASAAANLTADQAGEELRRLADVPLAVDTTSCAAMLRIVGEELLTVADAAQASDLNTLLNCSLVTFVALTCVMAKVSGIDVDYRRQLEETMTNVAYICPTPPSNLLAAVLKKNKDKKPCGS